MVIGSWNSSHLHEVMGTDRMPGAYAAAKTMATDTIAPSADDGEVAGPSIAVLVGRPPLLLRSADDSQIPEPSSIGIISAQPQNQHFIWK